MWLITALLLILSLATCGAGGAALSPEPPPAPAPGDVRLWQDARIFEAVGSTIDAARASGARVWVEMYEFEREDLAQALLAARAAGSDVRLLVDPSVATSLKLATRLRDQGLPVRFYPVDDQAHQIDHVKLLLAGGVGLVGGMNWGRRSHLNHDYILECRTPSLLARLSAVFEQDWSLAAGHPAPLPAGPPPAAQTAPGQEIRRLLLSDAGAATGEILAEVFVLTDHEVLAALAAAARRGVRVRILLDPHQDVNRAGFDLLRSTPVQVRWYPIPAGAKLHAKTGLFGSRLVVGSANWSRGGLSINHELDLETADVAAVASYRSRFEADWSRSPA